MMVNMVNERARVRQPDFRPAGLSSERRALERQVRGCADDA